MAWDFFLLLLSYVSVLEIHQIGRAGLLDMAGNTVYSQFHSLSLSVHISVHFSNSDRLLFAGFYTAFTVNTFLCIHRNGLFILHLIDIYRADNQHNPHILCIFPHQPLLYTYLNSFFSLKYRNLVPVSFHSLQQKSLHHILPSWLLLLLSLPRHERWFE